MSLLFGICSVLHFLKLSAGSGFWIGVELTELLFHLCRMLAIHKVRLTVTLFRLHFNAKVPVKTDLRTGKRRGVRVEELTPSTRMFVAYENN